MSEATITLPAHLSYSQANSMGTCSWRWVLERGFKVPQQPSWAQVAGNGVHTATEWWDNWTLNGEWVTDHKAIEKLFNDAFDKEIADRLKFEPEFTKDQWRASGRASKAWPEKENEAWWRANGPSQVMSWVTWRSNNPRWEIAMIGDKPGIELDAKAELGGVTVQGYIDRLFTNPEQTELLCLDLKSGSREPESDDQLGTYKRLLEETYGVTPSWGTYWMSRTGGTTTLVDMAQFTKERVDHTYRSTRAMQEQGLFLPKKSALCGGCSVRSYCLAVNGSESDTVPTPWEIQVISPDRE